MLNGAEAVLIELGDHFAPVRAGHFDLVERLHRGQPGGGAGEAGLLMLG